MNSRIPQPPILRHFGIPADENSAIPSQKSAIRIPNSAIHPPHGLLPYQSAFATNPSRLKIGLWARQTGKDHTCAFEAVADSIRNPGTLWLIVAASERQALESLDKAREWAQ